MGFFFYSVKNKYKLTMDIYFTLHTNKNIPRTFVVYCFSYQLFF